MNLRCSETAEIVACWDTENQIITDTDYGKNLYYRLE